MTDSFRRLPDFDRRADLIETTLDCIADLGIQSTTVRAVAGRAGVSNGLIRHHFLSKDNLIVAAYRRTIELVTGPGLTVLNDSDCAPHERLARFVVASLSGSVADPRLMSLWATFISQIHINADFAREHHQGYVAYRDATEVLISEVLAAEGRPVLAQECRRLAIALTALIDGLWIEGCMSAAEMDEDLQIAVGLESVEKLLNIKLPGIRREKEAS